MIETCSEIMAHAYNLNMITARDGNISVRWESQPFWFITPAGVRKQHLQPAMWKKISVSRYENGEPMILDYTPMSEKLVPSSEYPIHSRLQEMLPTGVDNRVVLHLHPTYINAAMHRGLKSMSWSMIFQSWVFILRLLPVCLTLLPSHRF